MQWQFDKSTGPCLQRGDVRADRPVARRGRIRQRFILAILDARIALRRRRVGPAADEARRHEWSGNTRRMGIRFTERLRDAWRSRWIRLHPNEDN